MGANPAGVLEEDEGISAFSLSLFTDGWKDTWEDLRRRSWRDDINIGIRNCLTPAFEKGSIRASRTGIVGVTGVASDAVMFI